MNVAVYDPKSQRLKHLPGHPGMTPDGLREFSLFAQVAAMAEGKPLNGILVGWEDAPSPYIGIFLLGDTVSAAAQVRLGSHRAPGTRPIKNPLQFAPGEGLWGRGWRRDCPPVCRDLSA